MDGVLVDNFDCHVEAFQKLGEEQGVKLTGEQVRNVFGRSTVEMFSAMTGREIGGHEGVALDKRKEELCREISRPRLEQMIVPGLRTILEACKSCFGNNGGRHQRARGKC